jgi:hypothetical protein
VVDDVRSNQCRFQQECAVVLSEHTSHLIFQKLVPWRYTVGSRRYMWLFWSNTVGGWHEICDSVWQASRRISLWNVKRWTRIRCLVENWTRQHSHLIPRLKVFCLITLPPLLCNFDHAWNFAFKVRWRRFVHIVCNVKVRRNEICFWYTSRLISPHRFQKLWVNFIYIRLIVAWPGRTVL